MGFKVHGLTLNGVWPDSKKSDSGKLEFLWIKDNYRNQYEKKPIQR
jgi:hypothetical protein